MTRTLGLEALARLLLVDIKPEFQQVRAQSQRVDRYLPVEQKYTVRCKKESMSSSKIKEMEQGG